MEMGMDHAPHGQLRVDGHPSGSVVVTLVGEHDLSTSDELDRTLSVLLAQSQPVIVDTSLATFLDSTTLGTLLSHSRKARTNAIPWRIVLPPAGHVRRVFAVAGSLPFLETSGSLDEALSAVTSPGTAA
jgi:anti-sigma B factor antagonist